jgi:phosphocarrier protein FPr/phosphocarrier protein
MSSELTIRAPIAGWAAPLAEVDDPVFAEAMLGDGIAIDPTGSVLVAPCAGVVGALHAAGHALTLKAADGLEILLHVGLETVALGGAGFKALVKEGDAVAAGDPLIALDLDRLAQDAKSLITPMVITELGAFAIGERHADRLVAPGDPLIELVRTRPTAAGETPSTGLELRREVAVALAHGLHARPAARMAVALKALTAEVDVAAGPRRANARSPMALMALGVGHGEIVVLTAKGPDAEPALATLAELLSQAEPAAHAPAPSAVGPREASPASRPGELRGVCAAPGVAIGRAFRWVRGDIVVVEAGRGLALEHAALEAAIGAITGELRAAMAAEADPTRASVLAAHSALVEDPELRAEAERRIAGGKSAAFAWKSAVQGFAAALSDLADARLAERADDLRDLEQRVLEILAGEAAPAPEPPAGAVLIADDLLPSQLLAVPAGRLAGLAVGRGGPTSHVAILAAAMGLPAIVAAGPALSDIEDGATLILDAEAGLLKVAPDAAALEAAQRRLAAQEAGRAEAQGQARQPARLADGTPVAVLANLGSVAEAQAAVVAGAEGSGLLRTEFLFLDRDAPPEEAEQTACYQAIADALEGRPLVVRLLDIGADKPARYLPAPPEENPALGVRGVRLALRRPELLATQLRAILKVRAEGLAIMVPMVASLAELRAVRATLDAAAAEVGAAGVPDLGVMIETPAAAMIADQLAAEASFLSIGTNDLSQYALAMDRGHPELAGEVDALEPAVLRLVAAACRGGAAAGRPVGVCGALAGDLAAIPILIGLGASRLSMPAPAVAAAKALIRRLSPADCRALAEAALGLASADAVRALSLTRTGTET